MKSPVYHNHSECNTGNNIERENRRSGTGGKILCAECSSLRIKYEDALFEIKAYSKSNARLTRFKIPVKPYIIGHSFDTWFEIRNISDVERIGLGFTIELKMDEYVYTYKRKFDSIPTGAIHKTAPINWKVLNQGVCTFSFTDIIVGGCLSKANVESVTFVDTNGKAVESGKIFHSVVTTTPEGVYGYWAMIISATGLGITALNILWPTIIWPLIKFIIFLIRSMGEAV